MPGFFQKQSALSHHSNLLNPSISNENSAITVREHFSFVNNLVENDNQKKLIPFAISIILE